MERKTTIEIDGVAYEAEYATIERAYLGWEDRGQFTAYLSFTGPGWAQSENAHSWTGPQLKRYIEAVLKTLGIESWDGVAKQEAIVLRRSPLGSAEGFAHRSEDRYMLFDAIAADGRDQ